MQLTRKGHDVIAIVPRETNAATALNQAVGKFIRARIEDLSSYPCRVDLVCGNYPSPYR
jgi:hypothetical protein